MTVKKYLHMQKTQYEREAANWSLTNKDPVVGWYDYHEKSPLYDEMLFRNIDTKDMVALDYGCGPGRCIIRFDDRFKEIDGVDIGLNNIDNAHLNIRDAGLDYSGHLMVNDGKIIGRANNTYDMVYAVITLQHIAVHEIRYKIMKEIFRVLKPGGWFCFQMGHGGRPDSVGYYDNHYDALGTNGRCDVTITNIANLYSDLDKIGFSEYNSELTEPIQDLHKNWIWVQARK
jgi:ubiquinone/menaquinone biosynthesis C-methylase UbiE